MLLSEEQKINYTCTWEHKLFSDCIATNAVLIDPNATLGITTNELHWHYGTESISMQLIYNAVPIDPDGALGRNTKEGAHVAGSRSLIFYI